MVCGQVTGVAVWPPGCVLAIEAGGPATMHSLGASHFTGLAAGPAGLQVGRDVLLCQRDETKVPKLLKPLSQ